MSVWTSIIAEIRIKDFRAYDDKDVSAFFDLVINDSPKITGSEEDARIFIRINNTPKQTCEITLRVIGNLRDRSQEDTEQEFNKFLDWLSDKSYLIKQVVCCIE